MDLFMKRLGRGPKVARCANNIFFNSQPCPQVQHRPWLRTFASRPSPRILRRQRPAQVSQQLYQDPVPEEESSSYPRKTEASVLCGAVIIGCTGLYVWQEKESVRPRARSSQLGDYVYGNHRSQGINKYDYRWYCENFHCSRQNVKEGRWWVLLTHTFAHGNALHLFMNMMATWSLGRSLIVTSGKTAFFGLWIAAGVGSSAFDVYWPQIKTYLPKAEAGTIEKFLKLGENRSSVGASGALFGFMGWMGALMPGVYGSSLAIALGLEVAFLAFDVLPMFDHTAHLSGAAIGYLGCMALGRRAIRRF